MLDNTNATDSEAQPNHHHFNEGLRLVAWIEGPLDNGKYIASFVSADTPTRVPAREMFDDEASAAYWVSDQAGQIRAPVQWVTRKWIEIATEREAAAAQQF